MKKTKFLSLFLALAMITVPSGKAEVIKPAVHARLRNPRLYQHVKTGLEKNIIVALRSTNPKSNKLLIKLFGTYCFIVADHIHLSTIISNSVRVPYVPRARIPKDINRAFILQQKVRAKLCRSTAFRNLIPDTPIIFWSYAGYRYRCNPDLVYDHLPEKYRDESLVLVEVLSNFSAPSTMKRESVSCQF